jgi:hypothetical protein
MSIPTSQPKTGLEKLISNLFGAIHFFVDNLPTLATEAHDLLARER